LIVQASLIDLFRLSSEGISSVPPACSLPGFTTAAKHAHAQINKQKNKMASVMNYDYNYM